MIKYAQSAKLIIAHEIDLIAAIVAKFFSIAVKIQMD